MKDYDTYHSIPEIKKRLQRHDTRGGWVASVLVAALMSMAVEAIMGAPGIVWQITCSIAAVTGIGTAYYVMAYSGSESSLKKAQEKERG